MTDFPEPAESPEIEEVRRLLADARHSEPMPDDVVARMDDALSGLRETPASATAEDYDDAVVVPLAAHRRRRAAGLLVAAAAIVVGGVVVAENLPSSSSSSSTTSGGAVAQDGTTNPGPAQRSPGPESFAQGQDSRTSEPKAVLQGGLLVVHPRRFSVDALAGRRLLHRTSTDGLTTLDLARCASVPTSGGAVLGARYRRAPAALVYRTASGGSQVVDLYVCGSHRPIRSATLPAP